MKKSIIGFEHGTARCRRIHWYFTWTRRQHRYLLCITMPKPSRNVDPYVECHHEEKASIIHNFALEVKKLLDLSHSNSLRHFISITCSLSPILFLLSSLYPKQTQSSFALYRWHMQTYLYKTVSWITKYRPSPTAWPWSSIDSRRIWRLVPAQAVSFYVYKCQNNRDR